MKITSFTPSYFPKHQKISSPKSTANPHSTDLFFGTNNRTVNKENGDIKYKNTTEFFRRDMDWAKTVDILLENFKNYDSVPVYNYACSDGSEPYSLAMMLEKRGHSKFFPIIARDIDNEILSVAKSGVVMVAKDDYERFEQYGIHIYDYLGIFSKEKQSDLKIKDGKEQQNSPHFIKKELREKARFEKGDIINDIFPENPHKPCVVIFRNAWNYLTYGEQKTLARKLSVNLAKDSILITGHYDFASNMPRMLEESGFDQISCNIYKKL